MRACERGVTHVPGKVAFIVHLTIFAVLMDTLTPVGNDVCTKFFTAGLFEIGKGWKQPKCLVH